MRKHAQYVPLFHHLTVLHNRHAVADFAHHVHLMRNEYDGQVKATVNVQEQIEDLIGGLWIQRRGGFITQQYVRMIGQRAGNAHTLFLPAAQLRRVSILASLQADQLHQLGNASLNLLFWHTGNLH